MNQALALFGKLIRKLSKRLQDIQKAAISASMPVPAGAIGEAADGAATTWKPVETSLAAELQEAGDEASRALKEKQRQMLDSLDLSK